MDRSANCQPKQTIYTPNSPVIIPISFVLLNFSFKKKTANSEENRGFILNITALVEAFNPLMEKWKDPNAVVIPNKPNPNKNSQSFFSILKIFLISNNAKIIPERKNLVNAIKKGSTFPVIILENTSIVLNRKIVIKIAI